MKNVFLQKIRIPAAFLLVHSAILNALFADNRHFFVFAVGGTVFSALLLFCCIKPFFYPFLLKRCSILKSIADLLSYAKISISKGIEADRL